MTGVMVKRLLLDGKQMLDFFNLPQISAQVPRQQPGSWSEITVLLTLTVV